ncbi:MAG: hypothetical protein OYH76_12610 [Defluviicoccus sp.]|nr:hypothetical protein [Defluviicoccus sp.]MDE0276730.1 hypothetical protein [Defluviicoccus sp.]
MNTKHVSRRLRRFLKANEAVSALEYAILVGVVTVAVGAAIVAFSGQIGDAISGIGNTVTNTGSGITTFTGTPPSPTP